jgi:hypothetical protein
MTTNIVRRLRREFLTRRRQAEKKFKGIDPDTSGLSLSSSRIYRMKQDLFDPVGVGTMGWANWNPGFHPGLFGLDSFGVRWNPACAGRTWAIHESPLRQNED